MLKKRRLPSGIGLGPPWPIRLLNTLGPLVKAVGAVAAHRYPTDDAFGRAQVEAQQLAGAAVAGAAAARRRLQRRRQALLVRRPGASGPVQEERHQCARVRGPHRAASRDPRGADRAPAVRAGAGADRNDPAAAVAVPALGRPLPSLLGGLLACPLQARQAQARSRRPLWRRPSASSGCSNGSAPSSTRSIPSTSTTRRSAITSSAPTSSSRRVSISATCRATGTGGIRRRTPTSTGCTSGSCRRCSGSTAASTGC